MSDSAASEPHVFDFREIADYVIENDDTATAANSLRNAQREIDRYRATLGQIANVPSGAWVHEGRDAVDTLRHWAREAISDG